MEVRYDGSLEGLFAILARLYCGDAIPTRILRAKDAGSRGPSDLFSLLETTLTSSMGSMDPVAGNAPYSTADAMAEGFRELSPPAYQDFLYAWMSELPVEVSMLTFARRILETARTVDGRTVQGRNRLEAVRCDRGDPAVRETLAAAAKVRHEVHRLLGLLRFKPASGGLFVARCAPDHLSLPALSDHFSLRFGSSPWAILDEDRALILRRSPPEAAILEAADPRDPRWAAGGGEGHDQWEQLWRRYHTTIAIESRSNPDLQRRLMPRRYWKYLTEV